jgi:ParB-like nuclease domain
MNTMMVTSETKAVPPVVSSIQDIPLAKIRESKTNPRRFFDEAKLAELADNIRQHGVLQPILVRPISERISLQATCCCSLGNISTTLVP